MLRSGRSRGARRRTAVGCVHRRRRGPRRRRGTRLAASPPAGIHDPQRVCAPQRATADRERETLDKAALPAPSPQGTGRNGHRPPRNGMERRVAALWADLLAVPVIDVDADFFDIGGHSLLAARLISDVQRTFGVALPPASFFDNGRTVAKLAELLGAESHSSTDEVTSAPPLHFIFSDLLTTMSLRRFTAQWG